MDIDELVKSNIGNWGFILIPLFTGLISSFVIEAVSICFGDINLKFKSNNIQQIINFFFDFRRIELYIIFVISFIVTKIFNNYYFDKDERLLFFITICGVSLVFYALAGKFIVKKIIKKFVVFLTDKTDNI